MKMNKPHKCVLSRKEKIIKKNEKNQIYLKRAHNELWRRDKIIAVKVLK